MGLIDTQCLTLVAGLVCFDLFFEWHINSLWII